MPRVKLAADQYAAKDLKRMIRYLLADARAEDVCREIDISARTLTSRKADPEQFKVCELRKLSSCVRMSAEEKDRLRKLIIP